MDRPIAYDKLAREERFVRMRAREVAELKVAQGLPPFPDLSSGESILERAVDFVLADEITHVRMGSKWLTKLTEGDAERRRKAIEFQESIDERFNLGGVRREGDHEAVSISIATDVRRMAGFTEEEIERLIKTTQRSQVY